MVKRVALANPLGRLGRASDVAQMAAFLASSESDYLTALSITVAGGAVMS
jgi:NAD(P)-dependent dehydrogenase (short-subunit alcohol dehydrogenase family)